MPRVRVKAKEQASIADSQDDYTDVVLECKDALPEIDQNLIQLIGSTIASKG